MQAWGLFESQHGDLRFAYSLLEAAVGLDRTLAGVLRWRMFRNLSDQGGRMVLQPVAVDS